MGMKGCCFSQYMQTNIPVPCHACMKERQEKLRETYLENMNLWNYNRRMAIEEEKEMAVRCDVCNDIMGAISHEKNNGKCRVCANHLAGVQENVNRKFEHNGKEYQTFLKEVEMPVGGNLPELTSVTLERTPRETVTIQTDEVYDPRLERDAEVEKLARLSVTNMTAETLFSLYKENQRKLVDRRAGKGFGMMNIRDMEIRSRVYETEIQNRMVKGK